MVESKKSPSTNKSPALNDDKAWFDQKVINRKRQTGNKAKFETKFWVHQNNHELTYKVKLIHQEYPSFQKKLQTQLSHEKIVAYFPSDTVLVVHKGIVRMLCYHPHKTGQVSSLIYALNNHPPFPGGVFWPQMCRIRILLKFPGCLNKDPYFVYEIISIYLYNWIGTFILNKSPKKPGGPFFIADF